MNTISEMGLTDEQLESVVSAYDQIGAKGADVGHVITLHLRQLRINTVVIAALTAIAGREPISTTELSIALNDMKAMNEELGAMLVSLVEALKA